MTVYIEYVIIDNLVLDYLLMKSAFKTGRTKFTEIRLIIAAVIGTFFAVFLPYMNINGVLLFIFKIMVGEVMVFCAGVFKSVGEFIRIFLLFLLYTFVSGGAIIGLCFLFGADFSTEAGISALSEITTLPCGLLLLMAYLIIKLAYLLISGVKKKADVQSFSGSVSITDGNDTVELSAVIDTGNSPYDTRTGKPVSVVSKTVADKLILNGSFKMKGAHYTPYNTIKGHGKILVFEIDRLVIYCGNNSNIIDNAIIGVSPVPVSGETEVILHAGLLSGAV